MQRLDKQGRTSRINRRAEHEHSIVKHTQTDLEMADIRRLASGNENKLDWPARNAKRPNHQPGTENPNEKDNSVYRCATDEAHHSSSSINREQGQRCIERTTDPRLVWSTNWATTP